MYSVRVTTTSDRDMSVVDMGPGMTWERLTDVIRSEISPEAAALFAEPIADSARGLTHWHVITNEDPKPFLSLSETDQANLLAAYRKLEGDILAFAERLWAKGGENNLRIAAALRAALETTDREAQLWSVAGAPVLTGWGRRKGGTDLAVSRILTREKTRDERAVLGGSFITRFRRASLRLPAPAGFASASVGAGSFLPWVLWLLFGVIVATIFLRLLPACAIKVPFLGGAAGQCGQARREALNGLIDRNDYLRQAIRQAESRLAGLRPDCADTANRAGNDQLPVLGEIEARKQSTNAAHGRFEVTLAWNGKEDLDLNVYCPGGHLFYRQRDACGGTLDVDRNSSAATAEEQPIEHATWAEEPPPGNYRVAVVLYSTNGLAPRPVPFRIVIRDGDSQRTYDGRADKERAEVEVTSWRR